MADTATLTRTELEAIGERVRVQLDDFARRPHRVTLCVSPALVVVSVTLSALSVPLGVLSDPRDCCGFEAALEPGDVRFEGATAWLAFPAVRAWWEAAPTRWSEGARDRQKALPWTEAAAVHVAGTLIGAALDATAHKEAPHNG